MLNSQEITKEILKNIKVWSKDRTKLVVGIDGYAGSGKTTIANILAEQDENILVVHLDDFVHHWKKRKRMIEEAEDKSKVFEYNWYRYDDLEKLINEFKSGNNSVIKIKTYDYDKNDFGPEKSFDLSKKILVIDGTFLFHSKHNISKMIDNKAYLDIDFDKADERRIAREKEKWGKDYVSEDHPDNWTRYFKEAYRRYVKDFTPKDSGDFVVNL